MTQREEKIIDLLTEIQDDWSRTTAGRVEQSTINRLLENVTDALALFNSGPNDDFYDGVEEKEEKERMEDRGEMEHGPY
jgi:hypothetical protein